MDITTTGKDCRCTYNSCSRLENCFQCVAYHRDKEEFTACFFSPETERTYNRSFAALCKDRGL